MKKEQVWSISLRRGRDFFLSQQDISVDGCGFRCRSCRITLTALPAQGEGIFRTDRVRLTLEGSEEDIAAVYQRFFLQFLSAGG